MCERHNIIVILADTVRADHLSCYGYDRQTSPFVDSIAERGTVYESAYSSSIWTMPAYATLFTGLLPHEHGAVGWNNKLTENILVERLNNYVL